jgi:hypothetical protein
MSTSGATASARGTSPASSTPLVSYRWAVKTQQGAVGAGVVSAVAVIVPTCCSAVLSVAWTVRAIADTSPRLQRQWKVLSASRVCSRRSAPEGGSTGEQSDGAQSRRQGVRPTASVNLVSLNPQPLPPDATINLVALNPQPLPPDVWHDPEVRPGAQPLLTCPGQWLRLATHQRPLRHELQPSRRS